MDPLRTFTSSVLDPADRGRELGERHRADVARTVSAYRALFAAKATRPFDVDEWSQQAWATIAELAPTAADEIAGIAEGAALPVREVAMINARTELLAVADPTGAAAECSTVIGLPPGRSPVAVQTWDWYDAMAADWFVWTIPHPSGHVVRTLTEFGMLAKIGVSSRGLGVMLNLLRHRDDALAEDKGLGFPVHLLSRQVLDTAADVGGAVAQAASVATSASTALSFVDRGGRAASVELFPGGPGVVPPTDDLLVRTNHFLTDDGASGCLAAQVGPGSRIRRSTLLEALHRPPTEPEQVLRTMEDHREVGGVCAHPDPALPRPLQHATLATVVVDVEAADLRVAPHGPCARHR